MLLALLAALTGTFGYGAGTVLQAAGAARARGLSVIRHPFYLLGLACDAIAWVASLVALQRLPLFTVQALLAGSLCVTVLLSHIFLTVRLRFRDWLAVTVVAVALVGVAAASGAQSHQAPPTWFPVAIFMSVAVVTVGTLVFYASAAPLPLAVVAGIAFSGAALCARAVRVPADGLDLVGDPIAWSLVGLGGVGAVALSRALESGAVGLVSALLWVTEVLLPSIIGVAALGDTVRPGWSAVAVGSVVVGAAGCVLLAARPAPLPVMETGTDRQAQIVHRKSSGS